LEGDVVPAAAVADVERDDRGADGGDGPERPDRVNDLAEELFDARPP
jgi:hypothetical protein